LPRHLAPPAEGPTPFHGVKGRIWGWILQRPGIRYYRIQLAVAESPRDYERFLADIVAPRILGLRGRLGIFGVGEHTRLLLHADPSLARRIECFADNNAALWHQEQFGRPVLSAAEAVKRCDAFFLSTAVFQRSLRGDLDALGFEGPVLAVDDVGPPEWFLESGNAAHA
jgi:hypothetical protein